MLHTKAVLGGSRAADFFAPDATTDDSDWDFYIQGSITLITAFTLVLSRIGVVWEVVEDIANTNKYADLEDEEVDVLNILRGTLKNGKTTHQVQLMWVKGCPALWNIVNFHSSLVQCFISGFCAVSMYHDLTRKQEFCHWGYNSARYRVIQQTTTSVSTSIERHEYMNLYEGSTRRSALAAHKYVQRGFRCLRYRTKFVEDSLIPLVRSVGDNKSYIVMLKHCDKHTERDRHYMSIAKDTIKHSSWLQKSATTTWTTNHSVTKDALHAMSCGTFTTGTMKYFLGKYLLMPGWPVPNTRDEEQDLLRQYSRDFAAEYNLVPNANKPTFLYLLYDKKVLLERWAKFAPWMIRFLKNQSELQNPTAPTYQIGDYFVLDVDHKDCV